MLERLKTKLRSGRGGDDKSTRGPSHSTPVSASTPSPPTGNAPTAPDSPTQPHNPASAEDLQSTALGLSLVAESTDDVPGERHPVDIIVLHGLNGNAFTTWTHANGTMWTKDILPKYIPGCRVYTYGYASKFLFSQSLATLADFSRGLLDAVSNIQEETERVNPPKLPVVAPAY